MMDDKENRRQWYTVMAQYRIPSHMHDGLYDYIQMGVPPGDFLGAVLRNDLKEACARADSINKNHIWDYVNFLYNKAPLPCWGSPPKVEKWMTKHAEARASSRQQASSSSDTSHV